MASAVRPLLAEAAPSGAYARRFGALLRRQRRARRQRLRAMAAAAGPELSASVLRAYERGQRPLDAATLERLCELYDVPLESRLPEHQAVVFDLSRRELRIAGHTVELPASDDPAGHLQRYVDTVNRLRAQPMRSPATLRRDDTEAIAEALHLDVEEVADLLAELISGDAAARRRLLALRTGAGTLAAVVVVAGASTAISGTPAPEAETAVLSAQTEPSGDVGGDGHDDALPTSFDLPDSSTVAGPDLHPLPYAPPSGTAGAFEDETRVDAPGGPVVIERDTGVASSAVGADGGDAPGGSGTADGPATSDEGIDDDTWVHAQGDEQAVQMTREEYEAGQE